MSPFDIPACLYVLQWGFRFTPRRLRSYVMGGYGRDLFVEGILLDQDSDIPESMLVEQVPGISRTEKWQLATPDTEADITLHFGLDVMQVGEVAQEQTVGSESR